jgi:dihydroorotate dehydrogenase electron transfer subunit
MKLESTTVAEHETYGGAYRRLAIDAPGLAPLVKPGQFVHIRLPAPADAILRRPFSVFRAGDGRIEILYKAVGRGTAAMLHLRPGDALSVLGPLGNGFPVPAPDAVPVLVAGGYGMAALYLLAARSPARGIAFFGGAAAGDILCVPDFETLGWEVRVTTEDGSIGGRGLSPAPSTPGSPPNAAVGRPNSSPAVPTACCGPSAGGRWRGGGRPGFRSIARWAAASAPA